MFLAHQLTCDELCCLQANGETRSGRERQISQCTCLDALFLSHGCVTEIGGNTEYLWKNFDGDSLRLIDDGLKFETFKFVQFTVLRCYLFRKLASFEMKGYLFF